MLPALTLLLFFQTAGEFVAHLLSLPVPGPVIGMLMLFIALLVRGEAPEWLRSACQELLSHLSLLFVPAGVGVMLHFQRLGTDWVPVLLALVASTVVTIGVTALVMQAAMRRGADAREAGERSDGQGR